jgi:hypothetical protein
MALYKMYRKMTSGNWKYTEAFNSTLDPDYHYLINYFRREKIEWELRNSEGCVKFKNEEYN